ncbi:Cyclic nucleotide-gated cation channel alpha-3 [Eufriesea mexicana]|uniref:Cyclic nucleotide-gated cation channel alpha-3 n=1 Tax=Eufriesea mexicana TaxID=516756 RepID=A0A310SCN1_9HYME|nr:Cyclic nucleotide-gated cation channel alpha-3 [Eufriesea mexicana]
MQKALELQHLRCTSQNSVTRNAAERALAGSKTMKGCGNEGYEWLESIKAERQCLKNTGHAPGHRKYVFTIVSYLIGVFIFATIVGQVGNVITNRNANRLEFERLLDGAKTYMRHHKVPGEMKRRVLRWYDYSWSRGRIQGGGDINTALGLLPDKLKTELALHVNLSVLKKVTIFQVSSSWVFFYVYYLLLFSLEIHFCRSMDSVRWLGDGFLLDRSLATIARGTGDFLKSLRNIRRYKIDAEIRAILRPYRSSLMAIPVQFGMFKHDFSHDSGATGLVMGLASKVLTVDVEMMDHALSE